MFDWNVLYSIYAAIILAQINHKTIELLYYHFFKYSVIVKDLKHKNY